MNQKLKEDGFVIIKNFFDFEDVNKMEKIAKSYFQSIGRFSNSIGRAKPDWIKEKRLEDLRQLVQMDRIRDVISETVGEEVFFIGHNDLHMNRSVPWHKDRLNGEARKFELNNPWEVVNGEEMKIYKINIYLQEHVNTNDGLILRVGSHKYKNLERGLVVEPRIEVGDVIVFDQRISHKATWNGKRDRLLISLGFGVDNLFFDQFRLGTQFRQNKQNKGLKK